MLGGAYSSQFQDMERQKVDIIKTFADDEKADAIARARKLSLETNKRRRALVLRRKAEQQKEEKRRQQILSKRRDKQREATERFQRAHMPARPASGSSASSRWSPKHGTSLLEDALRIVRGSPATSRSNSARNSERSTPTHVYYREDSDPTRQSFNKYAHPNINVQSHQYSGQDRHESMRNKSLRNLTSSRSLFEQQLQTHQRTLIEQQQKSLREFNKQMMREVEVEKPVTAYGNDATIERTESLSSVDSLEETSSTSTLRENCDLESFNGQQNGSVGVSSGAADTNVPRALTNVSVHNGNTGQVANAKSYKEPRVYNTDTVTQNETAAQAHIQQRIQEEKEKYYQQRQQEIQLQLEEQKTKMLVQQKQQQQELQQQILEQQQKQQMLLQQQLQKQQMEQIERQQQQQEQVQIQQQKHEKYMQQVEVTPKATAEHPVKVESGQDDNSRPKAQMKAWATPPHPITQASAVISPSQNLVTHSSPYTSKNTLTNVTKVTKVMLYEKIPPNNSTSNCKSNISTPSVGYSTASGLSNKTGVGAQEQMPMKPNVNQTTPSATVMETYSNTNIQGSNKQTGAVVSPSTSAANNNVQNDNRSISLNNRQVKHDENLSFLAAVTNGLSKAQYNSTNNSTINSQAPTGKVVQFQQNGSHVGNSTSTQTTKSTISGLNKPHSAGMASKPSLNPGYYISSYSSALTANKQTVNGDNSNKTFDAGRLNGSIAKGMVGFVDGQLSMMHADRAMDVQDDGMDTDSVSTICEDREPEPKADVRSILKKPPSAKRGGILKKASSTGNIRQGEIRDSLEITRVHLQTSADEREQTPSKKNVRWEDLKYNEQEDKTDSDTEQDKLFVKRNKGPVSHKPPRPSSATTPKSTGHSDKMDNINKIPRASSASTIRASSIPRAKTQIVRPQAAAHIITQSSQTGSGNQDGYFNTNEKRVTIVNNNFMEKVPAMIRQHDLQMSPTTTPVNIVTAVTRPLEPNINYAVSSISIPKADSNAPFIYPTYVGKSTISPTSSPKVPSQAVANDGAVYDENGLRIDRTPTDDEINNLWENVRTCLSRNSQAAPDNVNSGNEAQVMARQAAPVSQKYIDGASLGQINSLNRVAQQPVYNTLRRQNSADSVSGYTKRYGLLQQRRQQPNPQSLKSRQQQQQQQQQGYTVYNAPIPSHDEPQPAGTQSNQQVSESMAGFLAAEQLAEQSVSDSRIHQAIDNAQLRQMAYNASRPQPKVKSALSVEEQRLLESLDRLNNKLKITEAAIPNKANGVQQHMPVQQHHQQQQQQQQQQVLHVGGFRGHTPIHSAQRHMEKNNQKARLRLTSATLKRNLYRQQ